MTTIDDRLEALAREDKWYLSCGDGVIWAPTHPLWLHVPGFWDEALVYYHPLSPLFSVAVVGADGRARPLRQQRWRWRPDRIEVDWQDDAGGAWRETRTAVPGGVLCSSWQAPRQTGPPPPLWLVAFTQQPGDLTSEVRSADGALVWVRTSTDRRGAVVAFDVRLDVGDGRRPRVTRAAAQRSEGSVAHPIWLHTPFPEHWTSKGLATGVSLEGISSSGWVHLALAVPVDAGDGSDEIAFRIRLAPRWDGVEADRAGSGAVNAATSTFLPPPRQASAAAWTTFLESFPRFSCSDPFLTRYYDYRLYGLRLNRLAGAAGHVAHPAIAEGIGYFHVPITYSAQCHMWEMRWSRDPSVAFGTLRNFLSSQKADGGFHGRLYNTHLEGTDFYHANWGDALAAVLAVHDDDAFAREAYDGLRRYASWLQTTRDAEASGLFDVIDQFETGQEYMSRYLAVDPAADRYGWENRIRLKGIDVSVYAYALFRQLATLARRFGDVAGRRRWAEAAERTGDAIHARCWHEAAGIFTDVAPGTLTSTGVKAAVGFYPLLTDLVSDEQLARLVDHLGDPRTFGTPWPLPSSSVDDPLFDPHAEWKGKRHVCPWNGRAWPMTTSHVIEGLLRQWHAGRRAVGPLAADLLSRAVRLFFDRGDLGRPTCYEHYNPLHGTAAFYRGIDDYMHSWVADLLLRGVGGLEPVPGGLRIDPLPVAVDDVSVEGACVAGHEVSVRRRGDAIEALIDGRRHVTTLGTPLVVTW